MKRKESLIIEKSKTSDNGIINRVILKDMAITNQEPNNIVLSNTNKLMKVSKIYENKNVFLEGYKIEIAGDSFSYPCQSSKIGIVKLGEQSTKQKTIPLNKVKNKCIILKINKIRHVKPLLHVAE